MSPSWFEPLAVPTGRPAFWVLRARRSCAHHGALWLALIALLTLTVVACSLTSDEKKQKALERGERYAKQAKFNEAIIEFRNALQIDPQFAPVLHGLGRAYAAKSWFGDAWRELTRAQTLLPDSVPVAVDVGKVLLELGAWSEADEQAQRILSRDPGNTHALTIRAGALLGRGKSAEAFSLLEVIPPGNQPEVDRLRADILLSAGKLDEAEATYRAVLATNPVELKALIGLGAISMQRKRFDEARALYAKAKEAHPDDPRPPLGLALTRAQEGNIADAIKQLEEIDQHAWNLGVVLALGEYYLRANRPADAARVLAPAVLHTPTLVQARYQLAVALVRSGDLAGALLQFEELDRQIPNDPGIRLRLASIYTQQGRSREALDRLDSISRQSAKIPVYHLERARALALLGRPDEAFVAGSTAQTLAPQMPEPYVLMGQVRAQRGDLKAAEKMFARASEVDASYVPARLAAGELHLTTRDVPSALKDFDAALTADPRSLPAATAKAMALAQHGHAEEAIGFVEGIIKSGQRDPRFSVLLGNLYLTGGQTSQAGASFRRALEADSKSSAARLGLARVALAEGKDEDAVAQLQAAVKERPDDVTAVLLLRSLYGRLGRPEQAVPALEAAVRADPRQLIFTLALGELYTKVGRYDDVVTQMSDLLTRQPDIAGARLVRGQAYLAKGNSEAALKDFQEAVKASPKSALAHFFLARVYVQLGRKEDARAELREAIRLAPSFAPAKRELAALSGEKQSEQLKRQELEQLREAVKADPSNLEARAALARSYIERHEMTEAESELRQLLKLAPRLVEPNFLMARILFAQKREEEAVSHLQAALRGNPSDIASNLLLAQYLASKGQREQAIRPLETALGVNPNLTKAKFLLANLYAQSRRFADALVLARQLQRADPKAAEPWLLIGSLEFAEQRGQAAVEAFENALKIKPDSVAAYRGLGQAYAFLDQNDRAEESYRRALKIDGDDLVSLNDLAWLLVDVRKKPDEALPLALKAERLDPGSISASDTLGWIYYHRQSYEDAEKFLTRAVERAPANGMARFHLAMVYAKLGRKVDAASELRRAAKLDPKLAERENIERLIKTLEN